MEDFSTRHTGECRILNEKGVSGCGFLASVLGPEIKQVLTAGIWLKAFVFRRWPEQHTSPSKSSPRLWRFLRAFFFSLNLCFHCF